jgi:hypothetical protein
MKTKHLVAIIGLAVVTGVVWIGRGAWRAHNQIVTLDVRNEPLAQVLHKIERQTWKKIEVEKGVDARITLHVRNKSLSDVLDRIAEQAGARWSKLYAVYGSADALRSLDAALEGDGKLELAGWTKVAPKPPPQDPLADDPDVPRLMQRPEMEGPGPLGYRSGPVMVRRTADGVFVQAGDKHAVESWSPEELVLDNKFKPGLDQMDIQTASATAAAEGARKVQGKWTTRVALRKSIMGIGFAQSSHRGLGADPLKRGPDDRFARLTPEQRVLQARQRLHLNEN